MAYTDNCIATISPERVLQKATDKTLTAEDITAYVLSRAEHRVQTRRENPQIAPPIPQPTYTSTHIPDSYARSVSSITVGNKTLSKHATSRTKHHERSQKQQRQYLPRYAHQIHSCTNMSDILVSSVSVFTGAVNYSAPCAYSYDITCNYNLFIEDPISALFTVEHMLTHAEQCAELRARRENENNDKACMPLQCDAPFPFIFTEYEASFVAIQFHPFPLALYDTIKHTPAIEQLTYGDRYDAYTAQLMYRSHGYASQKDKLTWLEERCTHLTEDEKEHERYMFHHYFTYVIPSLRRSEWLAALCVGIPVGGLGAYGIVRGENAIQTGISTSFFTLSVGAMLRMAVHWQYSNHAIRPFRNDRTTYPLRILRIIPQSIYQDNDDHQSTET